MSNFNSNELNFYQRQMALPEIGEAGQLKLKESSVLVVGAGGLGSPVLQYLAASGIGHIGCVDYDTVDITNLHRQVIHDHSDIGLLKTDSVRKKLTNLNPFIKTDFYTDRINRNNAIKIADPYDIIVDCSDNFPTRYLLNDLAVLQKKWLIFAGIHQFEGQVTVFADNEGPCYRCLYPEPPKPDQIPDCAEAGVFGVLPAVLGSIQATEVIKLILSIGNSLVGRLLTYDAKEMSFSEYKIMKDKNCTICGEKPKLFELIDYEEFCGYKVTDSISVDEFLNNKDKRKYRLVDIRENDEVQQIPLMSWEHIPMDSVLRNPEQLNSDQNTIFICHSGIRSLKLVESLKELGFKSVRSLSGGLIKLLSHANYLK